MRPAMELFEGPVADTALLSIVFLGNLVPLAVIAGIYWYVTNRGGIVVRSHPVPTLGRSDRAA